MNRLVNSSLLLCSSSEHVSIWMSPWCGAFISSKPCFFFFFLCFFTQHVHFVMLGFSSRRVGITHTKKVSNMREPQRDPSTKRFAGCFKILSWMCSYAKCHLSHGLIVWIFYFWPSKPQILKTVTLMTQMNLHLFSGQNFRKKCWNCKINAFY